MPAGADGALVFLAQAPTSFFDRMGVAGIYLTFIIAGLLVGGTWSAYRAGSLPATVILGVLAVAFLAGGILWLFSGVG